MLPFFYAPFLAPDVIWIFYKHAITYNNLLYFDIFFSQIIVYFLWKNSSFNLS